MEVTLQSRRLDWETEAITKTAKINSIAILRQCHFRTSARRLYLPSRVYQGIQTMAGLDTEILAHVIDQ